MGQSSIQPRLFPAGASGRVSVAALSGYWYAVARSNSLRGRPLACTLLGTPLVLFRAGSGEPSALLDRCAHRNVALSLGKTQRDGTLRCMYHGWEFRGDGSCARIPGYLGQLPEKLGRVPFFATAEQGGLLWVYATPNVSPATPAPHVRQFGHGYTQVIREVTVEATLHATLENALDVPHTAFLHGGLFRGRQRHRVTATTTHFSDRVETEYSGEPRPTGVAARLLAPAGGTVKHWDRFILPSVAEVEYRIGGDVHFIVTAYCTPIADYLTKLFAVVSFRTHVPGWLLLPILERLALRIFSQDARILKEQTRNIDRFGGERFTNTDLDRMGPAIWRLLKRADGTSTRDAEEYSLDAPKTEVVEFEV